MKILEIIPSMIDGGAERFVIDLSNELCKRCQLVLCLLFDPDPEYQYLIDEIDPSIRIVSLGKKPGLDFTQFIKIFGLLRAERPDVVHTHLRANTYAAIGSLFFRRTGFFHTIHNDAFKEVRNGFERRFRRFFFKRNLITPITISPNSNESFISAYGITAPMINNGRRTPVRTMRYSEVIKEIEGYKSSPQTKIYVHIGRIEEQKNQLMLTRAFKQFRESQSADAVLLIIGSIRDQELGKQLVASIAGECNIHYLGSRSNATDYLYVADFFCLSSFHEGLPISLLEAMACEATPICTPVGGIPSVIKDDESGILSTAVSETSYTQALERSYFSPDVSRLRANARASYEAFYSMERCAADYFALMCHK